MTKLNKAEIKYKQICRERYVAHKKGNTKRLFRANEIAYHRLRRLHWKRLTEEDRKSIR